MITTALRTERPLANQMHADDVLSVASVWNLEKRERELINLTANENVLSKTSSRFLASGLSGRYLLEDLSLPRSGSLLASKGNFTFPSLGNSVDLIQRAQAALCDALQSKWIEMRPLSGVHATLVTLASLTTPGDLVVSLAPEQGGHFATTPLARQIGRNGCYIPWNEKLDKPDYVNLLRILKKNQRKSIIFIDPGLPFGPFPLSELRDVVGPKTTLVYDASHCLGLIVGGEFKNPLDEGADIVQGNTHKSFPGAHKAIIAGRKTDYGQSIKDSLDHQLVSSCHTGAILANACTALEMRTYGKEYAQHMIKLARHLESELATLGVPTVPGSSTHIVAIPLHSPAAAFEAAAQILSAGVRINSRVINGIALLRIGMQEVARRGLEPDDVQLLARVLASAYRGSATPISHLHAIKSMALRKQQIIYSFDAMRGVL